MEHTIENWYASGDSQRNWIMILSQSEKKVVYGRISTYNHQPTVVLAGNNTPFRRDAVNRRYFLITWEDSPDRLDDMNGDESKPKMPVPH